VDTEKQKEKKDTVTMPSGKVVSSQFRGLKPFVAGQSGNLKGRPRKELSITPAIMAQLTVKPWVVYLPNGKYRLDLDDKTPLQAGCKRERSQYTWLQLITLAALRSAVSNPQGLRELLIRIDGPPRQEIDITTGGERVNAMTPAQPVPEAVLLEACKILATNEGFLSSSVN